MDRDIRWIQRFDNYKKAFAALQDGVELARTRSLSTLEKQGLIQSFEYTHELAWNTLKDYLSDKGIIGIIGSKDSTREAFRQGLLSDGDIWMEMIKARNLTSHTYDEAIAEKVYTLIVESFAPLFAEFSEKFLVLAERESHG